MYQKRHFPYQKWQNGDKKPYFPSRFPPPENIFLKKENGVSDGRNVAGGGTLPNCKHGGRPPVRPDTQNAVGDSNHAPAAIPTNDYCAAVIFFVNLHP